MPADVHNNNAAPYAAFDLDIGEILAAFWKRRLLIVICTAAVTGLAALWLSFQTPEYTAETIVQINNRRPVVLEGMEAVVTNLDEREARQSEIDLIKSPYFAGLIVDRLDLTKNPEFSPEPDATDLTPDKAQNVNTATIQALLAKVEVEMVPQSLTIQIVSRSVDAGLAAEIANTFADEYLAEQKRENAKSTHDASTWLAERLEELRGKLLASEEAVQKFKEEHNIFIQQGLTLDDRELSELNSQLILVRADLAAAEAKLAQARKLSKTRNTADIETAPEVMQSPLIQRLKEQEADLQRKKADLMAVYGPKHPLMQKVTAEEENLRSKIMQEVGNVVSSLENQVSIIRTREHSLKQSLLSTQEDVNKSTVADVKLQELVRQANADREIYESFLARSKEITQQSSLAKTDARIVSPAYTPLHPTYPRKAVVLAIAIILGGGLGLGIALVQMYMDDTFRTLEQMERILKGHTVLGVFPLVKDGKARKNLPGFLRDKPTSLFAEMIRKGYNTLRFTHKGQLPKTVMVTSSVPGEGKTAMTLALAHIAMNEGLRVIVIDGDMRRSALGEHLGIKPEHTLADVLNGDIPLEQAIRRDEKLKFSLLLSGRNTANSNKLVSSEKMDALLSELSASYDLVLIDTPPVSALADTTSIARKVDASLFLIRWGKTPRAAVRESLAHFTSHGLPLAGLVLTQVDMDVSNIYNNKSYRSYYTD